MTAPTLDAHRTLVAGYLTVAILLAGLALWGATARLSGAAIVSGTIEVEANRQVVQHPEGGVVQAVLARDGDSVVPGQVLIRLDDTRAQTELAIVDGQLLDLATRSARLTAERDNLTEIIFPNTVLAQAARDPPIAAQISAEVRVFAARQKNIRQEAAQMAEQIAQIGNRTDGINAQITALASQRDLNAQDLGNQQTLLDRGLTQGARVLQLRANDAALAGQTGKLTADLAEQRTRIAALKLSLSQSDATRQETTVTALRDLEFQRVELLQRQIALNDRIDRLQIRAPAAGIVTGSKVFARQSVIQPGAPLLYVIPQDTPFVVVARLDVSQISLVYTGQTVTLRFTNLDQRDSPEVPGKIIRLSPSSQTDDRTGQKYFTVEIAPDTRDLKRVNDHALLPGMPVEAFIRTQDMTPLAYLTKPLTDYFNRAFRG